MRSIKSLKFDYHTHHSRCGHATGSIEDYIKAAIDRDFDIIGISDHSPHFYSEQDQLKPGITMKKSEFPGYVDEVLQLKDKYKDKIDVLLGVESDYFPNRMDFYKREYKKYPLDYIIGSVHFLGESSIFDKKVWGSLTKDEKIARQNTYYQLIQQSLQSGLFHILGHIDCMKTAYRPFTDLPQDVVDETLRLIGETEVAIEVNTSGAHKGCGWYPTHDILERALYYGVDITFGSDAHVPERVGDEFADVQATLRDIGYKQWCYFKQQQKFYSPL